MSLFGLRIMSLVTPTKQVKESDRRLERAQALFKKHQAVMNPHDRVLAQSLLQYSKDLRDGLETKWISTQIEQAQLYRIQVDKTLQVIQAAVEKTDVWALEVKSADGD
ncbi:hypothetical protein EDB92DRAFT_1819177 [Lactarius akahatsu]|uniref:Uncharacterized protein n=1 Tax=Lactarius akahatsu TaxID=416441 RepID=A0AAD4Q4S6_9AGAM|nr:hypothetical protein EDB92DRAFT_1819177 [Lactarius akahatsu]